MLLSDCDTVSGWAVTDVSKDRIVFLFRAKQSSKSDFLEHVLLLKMFARRDGCFSMWRQSWQTNIARYNLVVGN